MVAICLVNGYVLRRETLEIYDALRRIAATADVTSLGTRANKSKFRVSGFEFRVSDSEKPFAIIRADG